jgi:nucleoside-diphosphate-sugar epimerase
MRILIAGCGDVGNVLAELLLQTGHVVYGLKRDVSSLPEGVEPIQADLTRPATLEDLPADFDGLVFMPTPGSRDQASYEAIFIDGLRNLCTALDHEPGRTLLVSSTAVFGQSDGSIVNEDTEPEPARFNGQVLLEMERLGKSYTEHLVVARISGIYGPGREGMIRLAGSEGLEVQQTPPFYTNRIHRDDAAAALLHLLTIEDPQDLYIVSDDCPAARYEVLSWLAAELGNTAPSGLASENATRGKRVDNLRLRKSGFQLMYPDYRAGYTSVLEQRKGKPLA